MEELPTTITPTPKLPNIRSFSMAIILLIASVLIVVLPIIGFYFGSRNQKQSSTSYTLLKNDEDRATLNDSILMDDIKKLGSDVLVSDWQERFAVYIIRRDSPFDYSPFGQAGGSLNIDEDLVILNLETGERKVYEFAQSIVPLQIVEFLKEVSPDGGSHYRLHPEIIRWSTSSENVFWGKLTIYSNGDPPLASEVGLFKTDIKNSKIENFVVPSHGLFGAVNVNINTEKVLYESVGNGLSLYMFDLKSEKDQIIISYNKDVFDKYCASTVEYVYTSGFYGDCGRDRGLRADWDGEGKGINYFDFVTQKRVNLIVD